MLNSFIKSFWTLETGIQHAERYWPKIEMDSIPHNNLQTKNAKFVKQ